MNCLYVKAFSDFRLPLVDGAVTCRWVSLVWVPIPQRFDQANCASEVEVGNVVGCIGNGLAERDVLFGGETTVALVTRPFRRCFLWPNADTDRAIGIRFVPVQVFDVIFG